jgi:membrane-bound ClpP family serine protease
VVVLLDVVGAAVVVVLLDVVGAGVVVVELDVVGAGVVVVVLLDVVGSAVVVGSDGTAIGERMMPVWHVSSHCDWIRFALMHMFAIAQHPGLRIKKLKE